MQVNSKEGQKSKLTCNLNKVCVMRSDRVGEGVFCSIGLDERLSEFEAKKPNLISKGKGAKKDGIRTSHGRQVISL